MWYLYMVRCADTALYTGITTDVVRRFAEHREGKGAKYLRGKGPLQLVFAVEVGSRAQALRMEVKLKRLDRRDKEAIAQGCKSLTDLGVI